ncbi:MAG: VOC family protein [Planctomycetes bacterium]|nr:VOC family protein [Planctomycetota bacterium]
MLRGLKFASIPVGDQDRALAFYTGKLGLAVATDQPMGEGADAPRWIELRIPGADTRLVLFTPEEHRDRVGTFTGLSVWTEDVETAYRIYVERGVEFVGPPAVEPWGTYALLKDPDGNVICLSSR